MLRSEFGGLITLTDVTDQYTAKHKADIVVHYKRVTLTFWTHSEGGLTAKDFAGAAAADKAAPR